MHLFETLRQYENRKTFGSIQETVDKTKEQREAVERMMDKGYYDWSEANLYRGLTDANKVKLFETLRKISFPELVRKCSVNELNVRSHAIKEFLASSGTTGIAGAAYLVPDKIYQIMFDSAVLADVCADISITMIPAEQIPGSTLKVDIAVDDSYKPKDFSSGGVMPTETIETTQATLDFGTTFGINFQITNDLIEDAQFDLVEMHLRNAGREMGEYASDKALTVLKTATDGDGTVNSANTGDADETMFQGGTTSDIETAIKANCADGYPPNTIVLTHEAWLHSIWSTVATSNEASNPWRFERVSTDFWPTKFCDMNVVWSDVDTLTNDKAMTNCVTILFQKEYALLTGRKRWLRIEKYSQPISDLVGATVTARQDSVTVYNDSIYVLTET